MLSAFMLFAAFYTSLRFGRVTSDWLKRVRHIASHTHKVLPDSARFAYSPTTIFTAHRVGARFYIDMIIPSFFWKENSLFCPSNFFAFCPSLFCPAEVEAEFKIIEIFVRKPERFILHNLISF